MSLNIGPDAINAIRELRNNEHFQTLMVELGRMVRQKCDVVLESPPEFRVDSTAYARGLRDVWVAVQGAALNVSPRAMSLPASELVGA